MVYEVTLKPSGIRFSVDGESSLLEAAAQSNIKLAHSCRDGSCGTCKSKLLTGEVDQPANLSGVSAEEVDQSFILTCVAKPMSDIEIQANYFPELDGLDPAIFPCKVKEINFPAPDIAVINLRLPPGSNFKYLPGQYIDLLWNGERRSYSIANMQDTAHGIELHVRYVMNGIFSEFIFGKLKPEALLRLEGPRGTFFIRENESPIIFLAGGTGFAPVKAMIEQLISQGSSRLIYLYWGGQRVEHIYSRLPEGWQREYPNVNFIPVLSGDDNSWEGRKGLVHQAVLEDFDELSRFDVYACGSMDMINAAKSDFLKQGLNEVNFYSDAFTPYKPV